MKKKNTTKASIKVSEDKSEKKPVKEWTITIPETHIGSAYTTGLWIQEEINAIIIPLLKLHDMRQEPFLFCFNFLFDKKVKMNQLSVQNGEILFDLASVRYTKLSTEEAFVQFFSQMKKEKASISLRYHHYFFVQNANQDSDNESIAGVRRTYPILFTLEMKEKEPNVFIMKNLFIAEDRWKRTNRRKIKM